MIQKFTSLSKKYNIQEYIKQANMSLIELSRRPETLPEQFQEVASKLKVETGYDIWARFYQVRGCDDTVKLAPNKKY